MKGFLLFVLLLFSVAALTACNTTKGLGKDVEAAGETIEDVAEDTQEEIDEM